MAALSGKQVAAGALGVGAILGLCSCSTDTNAADPTGGPTTSVEQTMSPSPSADAQFNVRTAEESDWAVYSDEYTYSAERQSAGEQFIFDTYPDLWNQGVRVLSPKLVPGYNYADPAAPGAVVQYINGERYEGTTSEPLGFRGQIASPESLPFDTVANNIAAINGRGEWPAGNTGQGGYAISINEKDPNGTALEVYQFTNNSTTKKLGSTMYFGGWEEAWAYAQSNGFSVPGMDREMYPGEVSSITALRVDGPTSMSVWVFDLSVNNWVVAVSFD